MPATRARQLLIDFGEVVSRAQPAADIAALAADAGLPVAEFTARYWAHRPGYDRGASALGYWTAVLGHEPGAALLRRLVERDVASWCTLRAYRCRCCRTPRASWLASWTGTPS
jgi:putative hydrolase of the HAD superfamily